MPKLATFLEAKLTGEDQVSRALRLVVGDYSRAWAANAGEPTEGQLGEIRGLERACRRLARLYEGDPGFDPRWVQDE